MAAAAHLLNSSWVG